MIEYPRVLVNVKNNPIVFILKLGVLVIDQSYCHAIQLV